MNGMQTLIEERITLLSPEKFQKFCDALLGKMYPDSEYESYGFKTGTMKTTKGDPDSYFRTSNNKYILAEYTTMDNATSKRIYNKIHMDIEKCLDPNKTGILVEDIECIVVCHTTSLLSAGQDKKLHEYCRAGGASLIILGPDEMTRRVFNDYGSLAKDFLDIPLTTNQLLSCEDFKLDYNKNKMLAPLDTKFISRMSEKENLISAIRENTVTVVSGKAGVGKTRLVLEVLDEIDKYKKWNVICIKNKNIPIYDDLEIYTENEKNYLFFIDDANEFSQLNLFLDFIKRENKNVKIVLTVRDYAKKILKSQIKKHIEPFCLNVSAFTDEDILQFINNEFKISNYNVGKHILCIAEGNPRIAYMASTVFMKEKTLTSISNVTTLYANYYSDFVRDKINNEKNRSIILGLLALIKNIYIEDTKIIDSILKQVNINNEEFINIIKDLSYIELIDLQIDKIASISDQCFGNYMMYYVFYEQQYIDLGLLIHEGFLNFRDKLIEFINMSMAIFDNDKTKKSIQNAVLDEWKNFKNDKKLSYHDFVIAFHVFNMDESFLIVQQSINEIKHEAYDIKELDFQSIEYISCNDILYFMTELQNENELKTMLLLLDQYTECSQSNAKEVLKWLVENYSIDDKSSNLNFYVTYNISKIIYTCKFSKEFNVVLIHYIQELLKLEFNIVARGRYNNIDFARISLKKENGVAKYREQLWKFLIELSEDSFYDNCIVQLLYEYQRFILNECDKSLVEFDKIYVSKIVDNLYNTNDLIFAKTIRELLFAWGRVQINTEDIDQSIFETYTWKVYDLLTDNYTCSYIDVSNLNEMKQKQIIDFVNELDEKEIPVFIQTISDMINFLDSHEQDRVKYYLTMIVKKCCEMRKCEVILAENIYSSSENVNIYPDTLIKHLFEIWSNEQLYSWLCSKDTVHKNEWMYFYFVELPQKDVTKVELDNLYNFIRDDSDRLINSSCIRKLLFLDKFVNIDRDVYLKVSRIIYDKIKYNKYMLRVYFICFLIESKYTPQTLISIFKDDIDLLQKIYFYLIKHERGLDYDGRYLNYFSNNNEQWCSLYVDYLCTLEHYEDEKDRMRALWHSNNYLNFITDFFEKKYQQDKLLSIYSITQVHCLFDLASDDEILNSRKIEWFKQYIELHYEDDRIKVLFSLISSMDEKFRRKMIKFFLEICSDFKIFKSIDLLSRNDSSDSFVNLTKKKN